MSRTPSAAAGRRSTRLWVVHVLLALLAVLPLLGDHDVPKTVVGPADGVSAMPAPQCPQHDLTCQPSGVVATAAPVSRVPLPDLTSSTTATPDPGPPRATAPPTDAATAKSSVWGAQLLLAIGVSRR